jgi:hypothetical protein
MVLTKKKCMRGGVAPKRNRPSVKLNINENSSETNVIESKSEPLIHPDIGKPIPTLSNFTHIPKEFQAKTYNIPDLTPAEKQKMFNEIRRQNPHIKSKNLFSKYYDSLRKQYEEIQSKQLQKSKKHLTRGDLHVLLPSSNVNIKPENLISEEPISPEILNEIKRNSNNYAKRKIKELYKGYNMNDVNENKRDNNLNSETKELRKQRMEYLLSLRKNPIIHKEETDEERNKRILKLGYKIIKTNHYEIPIRNESSTNNNENAMYQNPPEPPERGFKRPPRPSNKVLESHINPTTGKLNLGNNTNNTFSQLNKELEILKNLNPGESYAGGYYNKKTKKSKKNSKSIKTKK